MKKTAIYFVLLYAYYVCFAFLIVGCKKQDITINNSNNNHPPCVDIGTPPAMYAKPDYVGSWYYMLGTDTIPLRIEDSQEPNSVHVTFPFTLAEYYFIGVNNGIWSSIDFPHEILFGAYPPDNGTVLSGNFTLNESKDTLTTDILMVEINHFDPYYDGDSSYWQHKLIRK